LIYSSLPSAWEGQNLDGSISITWRSGVVVLPLIAATQWISFLTFRRHMALQVHFGVALCVVIAACLFESSRAFDWESHNPDGTYSLTWRSDLVILFLASITQSISLLVLRLTRLLRRSRLGVAPVHPPNI
jgi:hypothetical protein